MTKFNYLVPFRENLDIFQWYLLKQSYTQICKFYLKLQTGF